MAVMQDSVRGRWASIRTSAIGLLCGLERIISLL